MVLFCVLDCVPYGILPEMYNIVFVLNTYFLLLIRQDYDTVV